MQLELNFNYFIKFVKNDLKKNLYILMFLYLLREFNHEKNFNYSYITFISNVCNCRWFNGDFS